jgi:ABC-type hemin transport system substrate-binding protein
MKRFRLRTFMLVLAFATLMTSTVIQQRRAARLEAQLAHREAQLDSMKDYIDQLSCQVTEVGDVAEKSQRNLVRTRRELQQKPM